MSGKPWPKGATQLLELLGTQAKLADEIHELLPKAERLEKAREEYRATTHGIAQLLRSMDVDSPGNWNWEGRLGWLLGEMRRQLKEEQSKKDADLRP